MHDGFSSWTNSTDMCPTPYPPSFQAHSSQGWSLLTCNSQGFVSKINIDGGCYSFKAGYTFPDSLSSLAPSLVDFTWVRSLSTPLFIFCVFQCTFVIDPSPPIFYLILYLIVSQGRVILNISIKFVTLGLL